MKSLCKMIILVSGLILHFHMLAVADGFIVADPGRYSPGGFSLAVIDHRVKVEINELAAETTIEQDFYNPARYTVEGDYLFPLPADASVDSFTLYQNGREMKSEILDSKRAARIYEDIVRRLKDPALLEYRNRNLIRVRIYPFAPGETKSVKIKYREILRKDNNRVFYSYPLNTEKFSSKPLKKVSVDITVKSGHMIGGITCPYYAHEIESFSDFKKRISYEDENVLPDRDFDISFSHIQEGMNFSLLTYKKRYEKYGFFLLDITPDITLKRRNDQDIIFVLDTSGSMRGEKIVQARESLRYCINHLGKDSRFQVISFSSNVRMLFDSPKPPAEKNLKKAESFIGDMEPAGGTNIHAALKTALSQGGNRHRLIVFITDGKPTIGETSPERIIRVLAGSSKRTRVFTFGIGFDINTLLLDRITEETKSFRTYIKPDENIRSSIASFFEKVKSPVLTDAEINIEGEIQLTGTCPGRLPDIFKGNALVLTGKYAGSGNAYLNLSGFSGDRKISHRVKLNFPSDDRKHDFLPGLWASKKIAELLDSIRLYGNKHEKISEIRRLATKYGILTPYTSYLILENEKKDPPAFRPFYSPFKKQSVSKYESYRQKYRSMIQEDGEESVQASREIQDMKQAGSNKPGKDESTGLLMKTRTISGIQFWFNGTEWIDTGLLNTNDQVYRKIIFLSEDYFRLIEQYPEVSKILSIGKNIRFILAGRKYHITEER